VWGGSHKGRLSYVVPRLARDVTLLAPGIHRIPDEMDRPHPIPSACQAGAQVVVDDHPDVQCTAHVRLWDLEGRVAVRHDEVVKSPRKVPVEPVFGLLTDNILPARHGIQDVSTLLQMEYPILCTSQRLDLGKFPGPVEFVDHLPGIGLGDPQDLGIYIGIPLI